MKKSTPAMAALRRKKIPFEVVTYAHEEKGAAFAARATGFPLSKTIKTLVVDLGDGEYGLALMPGDGRLSMKQVARAFSVKRAAMADTAVAERLTGYLVGGISPFGTKRTFKVVVEAELLAHEKVLINGGRRGVLLKMTSADIVRSLNAVPASLAEKSN